MAESVRRGTPLENILSSQSAALRTEVLTLIEKKAQTASIRILFPIVFFILPTLFIILFGPLAIQVSRSGSLF